MRVHELAKKYDKTNKEFLDLMKEWGMDGKTHLSGLTEEEIQRMVKDAEANRTADQERRQVVDTHNQLDGMIFATEKMIKDGEGKISAQSKTELESAVAEAKTKLSSESLDELKACLERWRAVPETLGAVPD